MNKTGVIQPHKILGLMILIGVIAGSFLLFGGSSFAITGNPFLSNQVSVNYHPTCVYASSCEAPSYMSAGIDGSLGVNGVFAETFGETSMHVDEGTDYEMSAVTCEFPPDWDNGNNYILGQNSQVEDFGLISQIQLINGQWIDYYYGSLSNGIWTHTPITKLYKVDSYYTNEDLWIAQNTGKESMTIIGGQKFLSHKYRCRIVSSWEIPRYGGGINIFKGTQKLYGKQVDLTGGGYGYCGDNVCSSTETEESCIEDCGVISPDSSECGEGMHYDSVNGEQVCVADVFPFTLFWVNVGLVVIGFLFGLYLLFIKK